MKRLLLIIALFTFAGTASAQDDSKGVDFYAAAGLSIGNSGNSTFAATSYPSIEFGMMKGNWALGLVAGRGSNDFSTADNISNYWWSLKNAAYFPIGKSDLDAYMLFSVGNYMNTSQWFIEYGGGFSYMPTDHLGLFIQASNWDRFWYITPGISYTF